MKKIVGLIFLFSLCLFSTNMNASNVIVTGGKGNDTTTSKSNIVIFRMISPAAPHENKSLKKAGSVARTSNSHASLGLPKLIRNKG